VRSKTDVVSLICCTVPKLNKCIC